MNVNDMGDCCRRGVELYFSQLLSLALLFLLMGLICMGNLLTNTAQHISAPSSHPPLVHLLLRTTLGARRSEFDLLTCGFLELIASLVLIAYLARLGSRRPFPPRA